MPDSWGYELTCPSPHPSKSKTARAPNVNQAKNAILFLGDGMGISTLTAARIAKGQSHGFSGPEEVLAWDEFPNTALIKVKICESKISLIS